MTEAGAAARRAPPASVSRRERYLGRLDFGQELVDGRAQLFRLLRQLAGGLEHRGGGLAGLLGALGDAGDVAAHLLGAARRLLDVARDGLPCSSATEAMAAAISSTSVMVLPMPPIAATASPAALCWPIFSAASARPWTVPLVLSDSAAVATVCTFSVACSAAEATALACRLACSAVADMDGAVACMPFAAAETPSTTPLTLDSKPSARRCMS